MLKILKKLFAGELILGLLKVFTNKLLFIEWLLEVIRAVAIYFLKVKARLETDEFIEGKDSLDMRTIPPAVKKNIIYDESVLKMRWDLCLGCEFLNESNKCEKCGCFMKVKHKIAHASCPVGKWGRYKEIYATATT